MKWYSSEYILAPSPSTFLCSLSPVRHRLCDCTDLVSHSLIILIMVFRLAMLGRSLGLLSFLVPWTSGQLLPETPATDPFYQPPAGLASTAPGTILRNRTVVPSFLGVIPDLGVAAHQLLYRTTAINGSAISTVTTIFIPANAKSDRFVSFHTAYDGVSTVCDPSYNYQLGAEQADGISDIEMLIIQAYLLAGYIVSSPDYEGPEAAFSVGRLEGMGVLDSMRAVSNYHNTLNFTTSTPKIVGYGYSGGAIATGWAASLKQNYAPELPVQGWIHGGTPANLTGTLLYIDGTAFSGFGPAAVIALLQPSAYKAQLQVVFDNVTVTPRGQAILDFDAQNCAAADLVVFAGESILSTEFQSLGRELISQPAVVSVMEQNLMGLHANETPTAPVYMFHSLQDEVIPYANASTLVDAWCHDGANVAFTTYASGGHLTTEAVAFADAFTFTEAAFNGTISPASGCSRRTVLNNTLDPLALGVELEPVLAGIGNALLKLGKGDSAVVNNITTQHQASNITK